MKLKPTLRDPSKRDQKLRAIGVMSTTAGLGTFVVVWIAEDVGDVAPPNYLIDSATVSLGPGADGSFTLSRPHRGWPLGKYRMELSVNGELAAVEPFVIQPD